MRKFLLNGSLLILTVSAVASQVPVLANSPNTVSITNNDPANTLRYWTPEKLRNAKPLALPQSNINALPSIQRITSPSAEQSVRGNGKRPTVDLAPDLKPLFEPLVEIENNTAQQPFNVGTQRAYFTSSRVIPPSADVYYPYRAVGKLFFRTPQGNSICSAAVLRPRIILTAGHCVHRGNGGSTGFYSNFVFIPAYRNGVAPLQRWSATRVITTSSWATGNARVPNSADFAIIEVADVSSRRIGDVTGYFGYQTSRLLPNHTTMLGYPANHDSGEIMHKVNAESFGSGGNNTVLYGSDMRGGSSGGPWVMNFGELAAGQADGQERSPNIIVGVTSYGPTPIGPLYQGSSVLNSEFTSILNTACGWNSRNCR
jgi:V8-like Glu-specific endopeptidase